MMAADQGRAALPLTAPLGAGHAAATAILQAELQVGDLLGQIVAHLLQAVGLLVEPAAQPPHLVLERLHPLQQLRGQLAAATPPPPDWRAPGSMAPARPALQLRLHHLQVAPQLQDLVLQQDPLAAVHLRARPAARRAGCGAEHAPQRGTATHQRTEVIAFRFCA